MFKLFQRLEKKRESQPVKSRHYKLGLDSSRGKAQAAKSEPSSHIVGRILGGVAELRREGGKSQNREAKSGTRRSKGMSESCNAQDKTEEHEMTELHASVLERGLLFERRIGSKDR